MDNIKRSKKTLTSAIKGLTCKIQVKRLELEKLNTERLELKMLLDKAKKDKK